MSDQDNIQEPQEVIPPSPPEQGEEEAPAVAPEQLDQEQQVKALEEELAQVRKALSEADIRAAAEVQNVRRRAERDMEQAHRFALEKFSQDLLSVADNLERGLAAMDASDDSLKSAREGVELTLKGLLDVFGRHGIERIDPKDQPFNPELHEAMALVPVPGVAANTVVDVLEKGYSLNGRLLRPARVAVSQGSQS